MTTGEQTWREYRPRWAQHVRGEHTERTIDPASRQPETQHWKVTCETCGETFGPLVCDTGMVRNHIAKFALLHTHCDALAVPKKTDPPTE